MIADDIRHRDGTWWFDAPLPRRWHKCSTWTSGWLGYFTRMERCACGAVRMDRGPWIERNSRRRGERR